MSNPFKVAMIRVYAPLGRGTQISVRGFNLEAESDRGMDVPGEVARELVESHGFVTEPPFGKVQVKK